MNLYINYQINWVSYLIYMITIRCIILVLPKANYNKFLIIICYTRSYQIICYTSLSTLILTLKIWLLFDTVFYGFNNTVAFYYYYYTFKMNEFFKYLKLILAEKYRKLLISFFLCAFFKRIYTHIINVMYSNE